jgi:holo-[acyl-carrier protein] synthase
MIPSRVLDMGDLPKINVGVDLVSICRIEKMLCRWGDRFLRRIYTDGEIDYCLSRPRPASSLAARFAAKEAFFKAVSQRVKGSMGHRSIEVVVGSDGIPAIRSHGEVGRDSGDLTASLSISHEEDVAIAVVVTSSEDMS